MLLIQAHTSCHVNDSLHCRSLADGIQRRIRRQNTKDTNDSIGCEMFIRHQGAPPFTSGCTCFRMPVTWPKTSQQRAFRYTSDPTIRNRRSIIRALSTLFGNCTPPSAIAAINALCMVHIAKATVATATAAAERAPVATLELPLPSVTVPPGDSASLRRLSSEGAQNRVVSSGPNGSAHETNLV